jgi:hypothetical protein
MSRVSFVPDRPSLSRQTSKPTHLCFALFILSLLAVFAPVLAAAQTLQFTQIALLKPCRQPGYVVMGDLNGDGKPDLVVPCGSDGAGADANAYVLLGNGDGTFGPASSFAIGSRYASPGQSTLADLRGNGKLDLIISTFGGLVDVSLDVWLGKGDGTFQGGGSYGTTLGASGVTVGDFNGDKKPDLAVSTWAGFSLPGVISVFSGNGDGTFGTTSSDTNLVTLEEPTSIASGDFNRDGLLDVAVGSPNSVGVLLGNGNNFFQPEVQYPVASTVSSLITADLNGDGFLDIGAANGTQVSVLLGKGDGTFQNPINTQLGSTAAQLACADMNSDGKLDLVVSTANGVTVLLGNGDGTFNGGATIAITGGANSVAISKFSSTGLPGFAVTNFNPLTGASVLTFAQGSFPNLLLSPSVLNFAAQAPGVASAPQTVTLTNIGTTSLTISSIALGGTNPTSFQQTNNCSMLAATSACQVEVASIPSAAGAQSASLNVTDTAPGSPQTAALNGTGQDFALVASSQTSVTVTQGQAANFSVSLSPVLGFKQSVTLSCSGQPAHSTCTATPSSVMLNGSSSTTANIAVVTMATSAGLTRPAGSPPDNRRLAFWLGFSCAIGLGFLQQGAISPRPWRTRGLSSLALLCLLSLGISMSACGGGSGSGSGTPKGTYNVTLTGTYTSGSATLTHAAKFTMIVQ